MINERFWENRRVFITGHTGFKGSWLCLWLQKLGAHVTGYALKPPTDPGLFELANVASKMNSITGDIRDLGSLKQVLCDALPEIVIHMAAQPLVRDSYKYPVETYETNVMGTVNLFEAVRACASVRAVVNVTTDKVYENREWHWGYRESEHLGGYDPYSSSKACSEIVTAAYRSSYFSPKDYARHGVGIATARAGNVIGGGDWAVDRLIPDCIRAHLEARTVRIRSPKAIRPWQFVLEPLRGYLMLAEKLCADGATFSGSWNFGPNTEGEKTVGWVVENLYEKLGAKAGYSLDKSDHPHEAGFLKLDSSKARAMLGWKGLWDLEKTLSSIADWTRAYQNGEDVAKVCLDQIANFTQSIMAE